jgi:hypothetical protein
VASGSRVLDTYSLIDRSIDGSDEHYVYDQLLHTDYQLSGNQFERAAESRFDRALAQSVNKGYAPSIDEVDALVNNDCSRTLLRLARLRPQCFDESHIKRCIEKDMFSVVHVILSSMEVEPEVLDVLFEKEMWTLLHDAAREGQRMTPRQILQLIENQEFDTVGILVLHGTQLSKEQRSALRDAGFGVPFKRANAPVQDSSRPARTTSQSSLPARGR